MKTMFPTQSNKYGLKYSNRTFPRFAVVLFSIVIGLCVLRIVAYWLLWPGVSEFYDGKYTEAAPKLSILSKLMPDIPGIATLAGNAYRMQNKNFDAIQYYKTALKRDPTDLEAYYQYGLALKAVGRNKNALYLWRRALVLFKSNPNDYRNSLIAKAIQAAISCD